MSSRRKPTDTSLFRTKEDIEQEDSAPTRDMSPRVADRGPTKRVSFDLYVEQWDAFDDIRSGLKHERESRPKVSELAQEAFDLLIEKYRHHVKT
jgi:hypothetical protein